MPIIPPLLASAVSHKGELPPSDQGFTNEENLAHSATAWLAIDTSGSCGQVSQNWWFVFASWANMTANIIRISSRKIISRPM